MGQLRVPRTSGDRHYQYFPAFLDLVRKQVVVVGGGTVAASKVQALLPCGLASLTVIAPEVGPDIRVHATCERLRWVARSYIAGDLAGADLAFAATDDRGLNAAVAAEARGRGVPVLAVDDVANCDFIAPALARRGALVVAVSTHGRSPAIARRVREWLDATLPVHLTSLLEVAADVRDRLGPARGGIPPTAWQAALDGEVEVLAGNGDLAGAAALLEERLRRLRL